MDELTARKRICLSYWYPMLLKANVKTPKTIIFQTDLDLIRILDREHVDGFDEFVQNIKNAAEAQIGYPLFLRTGQGSGKHQWTETCFVESPDDLPRRIGALVEWSEMVQIMGLPWNVWVIREMIQPEIAFKAFRDLPISKERRYFIEDGKVLGHMPYWPEGAIADWAEPIDPFAAEGEPPLPKKESIPENWRELLADLNHEDGEEIALLTDLSYDVAQHFDGAWSVDWLWDVRGDWYCIDMAVAHMSWGWDKVKK